MRGGRRVCRSRLLTSSEDRLTARVLVGERVRGDGEGEEELIVVSAGCKDARLMKERSESAAVIGAVIVRDRRRITVVALPAESSDMLMGFVLRFWRRAGKGLSSSDAEESSMTTPGASLGGL